ncbi:MAG TPA: glycerate kinase [Myxococcaceae bacterium]|nr:glycerate kinase [Myxococcaceae bacterium]
MTARILVAPLEFKGSLTAGQAARAMEAGVRAGWPEAEIRVLPLADGGPGTADALVDALGGSWHTAWAHDALGRPLQAQWASWPGGGVVEMARASGLSLLDPSERDALVATTAGTGELIADALESGIRSLLIGVGGSATNDGGAGALQALGYRLLDASGRTLSPGGAALRNLARIVPDGVLPAVREAELTVMTDVLNPLCGPTGASHVYGPQKGASPEDVETLDAALAHLAEVVKRDLGIDAAHLPGTGAAGGLAYGLLVGCGAQIRRGFEHLASLLGLDAKLQGVDWVLTGEGRLDTQTLSGKGPLELARRSRLVRARVVAFAGKIDARALAGDHPFDDAIQVSPPGWSEADPAARASAGPTLSSKVEQWARGQRAKLSETGREG